MKKKGFTLIELIVTIAILGTLVLIATPKYIGQIEEADLVKLQYDIKVMEENVFRVLKDDKQSYEKWDYNGKDLDNLIEDNELYGIEGVVDKRNLSTLKKVEVVKDEELGTGGILHRLFGGGSVFEAGNEVQVDYEHRVIPDEVKKHAGVKLKGTFYTNDDGRVYYEFGEPKPIPPILVEKQESEPEPIPDTMFHGESELISYEELVREVGLVNVGKLINYPEEVWLEFSYNGNKQYVAKRPILTHISYNDLRDKELIYGNKTIRIDGKLYKVRLMKSLNEGVDGIGNKIDNNNSYPLFHESEYNQLMIPIHESSLIEGQWSKYVDVDTPTWNHDYGTGVNGLYKDKDLYTDEEFKVSSWMQEYGSDDNKYLIRGDRGVEEVDEKSINNSGSIVGWRPVLELIKED